MWQFPWLNTPYYRENFPLARVPCPDQKPKGADFVTKRRQIWCFLIAPALS
jgi:hypothetical protein